MPFFKIASMKNLLHVGCGSSRLAQTTPGFNDGSWREIREDIKGLNEPCPDLQSVCALVAQDKLLEPAYVSPGGPIAPMDILYGHRLSLAQGNLYIVHRTAFTEKT